MNVWKYGRLRNKTYRVSFTNRLGSTRFTYYDDPSSLNNRVIDCIKEKGKVKVFNKNKVIYEGRNINEWKDVLKTVIEQ